MRDHQVTMEFSSLAWCEMYLVISHLVRKFDIKIHGTRLVLFLPCEYSHSTGTLVWMIWRLKTIFCLPGEVKGYMQS